MHFIQSLIAALLLGCSLAQPQSYQLIKNYSGLDFFSNFDFWNASDPTSGYVKYVVLPEANASGLAGFVSTSDFHNAAYLGVDYSFPSQNGVPSTRIQSKDTFNSSTLFITDIGHHPGGICGVWSAYWLYGPTGGEIDLMENINLATKNQYVLHTYTDLVVSNFSDPATARLAQMYMQGTFTNLNCTTYQGANIGCVVSGVNNTFGREWNSNLGGVIALEYLPEAISVWQFSRDDIPADAVNGTPVPSSWRMPDAHFMSADGTSLADLFSQLQMVFNIDICGSWPDGEWSTSECARLADTCEAYAAQNQHVFKDAYFLINSVNVYQPGTASSSMNATTVSASNATMTGNFRRARRTTHPRNFGI